MTRTERAFGVRTPKGIMLSAREFESLLDYSRSLPTGQTVGKRWRREIYDTAPGSQATYVMGEYVESLVPGKIGIEWTPIILPDGYVPMELRRKK
jgi:hypothetical protein